MPSWVLEFTARLSVFFSLARSRAVSARGLGMLEYALMALVVLAVFGLAIVFFPNFFNSLTGNIENEFQQNR